LEIQAVEFKKRIKSQSHYIATDQMRCCSRLYSTSVRRNRSLIPSLKERTKK